MGFLQSLNKLVWVLPERNNFGLFDVSVYKVVMPRQGLTCPGICRVVSWGKMCCSNGECEKFLLSVSPPVTGFLSQKLRPLIRGMHVPLPAHYGWTETVALCIHVSPPFPSWLHSSTTQQRCSSAKTLPLHMKKASATLTVVKRVAGHPYPHTTKHSNYSIEQFKIINYNFIKNNCD